MDCGAQIFECMGFVKAGDIIDAEDGKISWWKVRERCWKCADLEAYRMAEERGGSSLSLQLFKENP